MYLPRAFRVQDRETLARFIHRYSFATLITAHQQGPLLTHLPLLLDTGSERWVLRGHFARGNDHWRHADRATAVFHGPHSYISPAWYARGGEVPTWNYAVVHASGKVRLMDSEDTARVVDDLTDKYEVLHGAPWDRALTEDYRSQQLTHIVGFELFVEELTGKFKLGQNRSADDQASMYAALAGNGDADSRALAAFIADHAGTRQDD